MKIMVCGGAGYIGSHTCIELVKANFDIVIVDNLSNSKQEVINRLEKILDKKITFYKIDCCDYNALKEVFEKENIDGIIHFAGLKSVPESVSMPLDYYQNNIDSTFTILRLMNEYNVKNLVFSSSATVYGQPHELPITEDFPLSATNPYGRTKLFIENILTDVFKADPTLNIALLRYFNPIGAHESGLIGEDPNGIPNNIVPYITQVAVGKLPFVKVTGNDYDTKDGTGVRDYIHVCDLAYGHVLAIKKLITNSGLVICNLGTGIGYSVLDIINAFKEASNKNIPFKYFPRRPGDIATCYANCEKAYKELGFKTKYDIKRMAIDSWRWQSHNPNGYGD